VIPLKLNREYFAIVLGYIIVILYIAFVNDAIFNIVLVVILFLIHISIYNRIKNQLSFEKDTSVSKLQNRLAKTKKKQEELNERFMSLSQSFGSGLFMVDQDGKIQYSNIDMNRYFGRDFNGVEYKKIIDINELYQFVNQAYLLEAPIRKQIQFQGSSYDLLSTPIFEESYFTGTLILAHDITLLKNAEEYQKRFTADVSHELKTPLSTIKGFSEILNRDRSMKESERIEFIELIQKESERMEVILKDLTEIAKLDRIDYELSLVTIDIKTVLEESVAVLINQLKSSNLELTVDVASEVMKIDKYKMSQVFINIIKNAISYTDEGSISIKGYTEEDHYKVEISDTGIGIAEENFDKIFKRFYRIDKARSRETGGSGLGLSISKNAVKKHGGTISVSSKINEGTTFTITLPINK